MAANRECDVAKGSQGPQEFAFHISRNETFCICLFQVFLKSVQILFF